MTDSIAAKRGIADRASGADITEQAQKRMRHEIVQKVPAGFPFTHDTLAMLGLVTRLHAFQEAASREIAADNPFASASLLRSLAEVVALLSYLIEKPADLRRVSLLAGDRDRFSIGKIVEAANRQAPGFKAVYAQLSNWAHPSHIGGNTSMTVSDDNHFTWQSNPTFKDDDDACTMYLWLLELTEVAGPLWCRLWDAASGEATA
ncbi:hypothetical protein CELL_03379 [Cellulomonas sp. T2.31MG-18]|uniref:hypothetical protein n=1 Tax=Cellulomonas sp. T2.31MG-18 TaxID=3157619 RepID=UPI0035E779FA